VTNGRIGAQEIYQIIDFARDMPRAPVELLPCVRETIASLRDTYRLMIITKGDLFDQRVKLRALASLRLSAYRDRER
jgi:hypothetical protein